jgi:hypothetical protein
MWLVLGSNLVMKHTKPSLQPFKCAALSGKCPEHEVKVLLFHICHGSCGTYLLNLH